MVIHVILYFYNDPLPTEIHTLSLHDALPISFDQGLGRSLWFIHGTDVERIHRDRKSTRLNSSHVRISYAVFCLKKKTRRWSYTAQTVSSRFSTKLTCLSQFLLLN